jgi:hypothetical protein
LLPPSSHATANSANATDATARLVWGLVLVMNDSSRSYCVQPQPPPGALPGKPPAVRLSSTLAR